jgi:hypothetical protein
MSSVAMETEEVFIKPPEFNLDDLIEGDEEKKLYREIEASLSEHRHKIIKSIGTLNFEIEVYISYKHTGLR